MKKSIWFLNQYAGDSESGWGERNFYLAEEFVKMGYDVTIFSATYNHLFRNVKEFEGKSKIIYDSGVRFCWIKTVNYGESRTLKRIYSWIQFIMRLNRINKSEIPKPDYIVVSSISIFPVLNATYFKRKYKARKFVLEIRDLWPLTLIMIGGISRKHPLVVLLSWLERYAYKKADDIVSVLRNADRHIKSINPRPFRFHWIPNGFKMGLLKDAETEKMRPYLDQIPKDKFVLMYAGTMGFINAMEYLVEASQNLKDRNDIHFVIIGDGDRVEELKEMAEGANVTFIPKVAKHNVSLFLERATAFVISWRKRELYKYGVSANKYSDYMMAGKPIITANSIDGDPVELANCGMVVEAENTEALTGAIREMSNLSKEELERMGERGREYALANLRYSELAKKYISILESQA